MSPIGRKPMLRVSYSTARKELESLIGRGTRLCRMSLSGNNAARDDAQLVWYAACQNALREIYPTQAFQGVIHEAQQSGSDAASKSENVVDALHNLQQTLTDYSEPPAVARLADWLREQKKGHKLDNLILLNYQPFEVLPDVLGSADVLLAVLEPDAGVFSVPSKVLTYLCAGRPLLLAVPPKNLAARIVRENGAGITVPPGDIEGWLKAADELIGDSSLRQTLARNARRYAEETFDINAITDRFERILQEVVRGRG